LQELAIRLPAEGPYRSVYFDLQDKAALSLVEVLAELTGIRYGGVVPLQ
jgi:hypothetical protein